MLRNYLKVAVRNLLRNRVTSLLNIFGLALGMACCFAILLYVADEKSYDRWLPAADRIYRVAIDIQTDQGEHLLFAPASGTLAPALKDYPQVEQATRFLTPFAESVAMSVNAERTFYETGFCWGDPNIFDVFGFQFLAGLPTTALQAPKDMVLTRSMAEKYFSVGGDYERVLGQTIKKDTTTYRVSGVIEDIPHNTSFRPDFIASLKELEGSYLIDNWHGTSFQNFVKLKAGTDAAAFEQQIKNIADRYVSKEIKENSQAYTYFLQPLTSIHLHSNLRYEFSKNNSHTYVRLFGLVALFILVLACINFINLTTAQAVQRAKEVGVRKATGARRGQLVGQFLTESLLLSTLAALSAVVLVSLSLPWFNAVADKAFGLFDLWSSRFVLLLLGITVAAGLLAGTYPAFTLSNFRPVEVLRGRFSSRGRGSAGLRGGLVVAQFTISIALIVATIVLTKQVQFLKNQHLGYAEEQLLVIKAPRHPQLVNSYTAVRGELGKLPGVRAVSVTGVVPGKTFGNNLIALQNDQSKSTDMLLMAIDGQFLDTYDIPLVAGRNLSENIPEDLNDNVLINEAALPFYGWSSPEEALGQTFGGGWGTVVGVVKNFHFSSLHQQILPLELYFSARQFSYVTLQVSTDALDELLPALHSSWSDLLPATPLDYAFLDETFDQQYRFEDRLSSLIKVFSGLAVIIACLGLFGLSVFAAQQRTKEIGIRKVLGASGAGIVRLLSADFLRPVLIALVLAAAPAWYFLNRWLDNFAYRIDIEWWVFAVAGLAAVGVAFLTVSVQSVRAALANPVEALKRE